MNIDDNGLPYFWQITKKDKMKCSNPNDKAKRDKRNRERIRSKVNKEIVCPMNYLYSLELNKYRDSESTLPMRDFFVKHEFQLYHRIARKVEELIEKYSLELYNHNANNEDNWEEDTSKSLLLRSDYEDMIRDIRGLKLGKKYAGLMSWLINRAFKINSGVRGNINTMDSKTNKNKAILIKTLYDVDKNTFLSCFV